VLVSVLRKFVMLKITKVKELLIPSNIFFMLLFKVILIFSFDLIELKKDFVFLLISISNLKFSFKEL